MMVCLRWSEFVLRIVLPAPGANYKKESETYPNRKRDLRQTQLSLLDELSILENGVYIRAIRILPRIHHRLDSINFVADDEFTGGADDANDLFVCHAF
jgi:hypothetical protein